MALKKWITKAEIKKLLNIYSVRADEFREVSECTFVNNFIKGYMLTIQEEFNGNEKTGRILVSHTKQNGRKTFTDIWERNSEDKLQFLFRNPWNCPASDAAYIKELEYDNRRLFLAGRELKEQLAESNITIEKLNEKINELENLRNQE